MKKKLLGYAGVDSGQLIIIDPCYLDKWKDGNPDFNTPKYLNDYDEACKLTVNTKTNGGQHSKLGVVFASGYGDGNYPVYGHFNKEGRCIKVEINMNL